MVLSALQHCNKARMGETYNIVTAIVECHQHKYFDTEYSSSQNFSQVPTFAANVYTHYVSTDNTKYH